MKFKVLTIGNSSRGGGGIDPSLFIKTLPRKFLVSTPREKVPFTFKSFNDSIFGFYKKAILICSEWFDCRELLTTSIRRYSEIVGEFAEFPPMSFVMAEFYSRVPVNQLSKFIKDFLRTSAVTVRRDKKTENTFATFYLDYDDDFRADFTRASALLFLLMYADSLFLADFRYTTIDNVIKNCMKALLSQDYYEWSALFCLWFALYRVNFNFRYITPYEQRQMINGPISIFYGCEESCFRYNFKYLSEETKKIIGDLLEGPSKIFIENLKREHKGIAKVLNEYYQVCKPPVKKRRVKK